jgi:hypothetical protein
MKPMAGLRHCPNLEQNSQPMLISLQSIRDPPFSGKLQTLHWVDELQFRQSAVQSIFVFKKIHLVVKSNRDVTYFCIYLHQGSSVRRIGDIHRCCILCIPLDRLFSKINGSSFKFVVVLLRVHLPLIDT